jgi:hypothetical protein
MEFKPRFVLRDDELNQLECAHVYRDGGKSIKINYNSGFHAAEIGLLS